MSEAEPAEPADTPAQRRADALVRFAESRRHHRFVHEGGANVRLLDDGAEVFTDAVGRRIEAAPPTAGSAEALVATHHVHGPRIDPLTATCRWAGERLDLDWAVAALCAQTRVEPLPSRPSS